MLSTPQRELLHPKHASTRSSPPHFAQPHQPPLFPLRPRPSSTNNSLCAYDHAQNYYCATELHPVRRRTPSPKCLRVNTSSRGQYRLAASCMALAQDQPRGSTGSRRARLGRAGEWQASWLALPLATIKLRQNQRLVKSPAFRYETAYKVSVGGRAKARNSFGERAIRGRLCDFSFETGERRLELQLGSCACAFSQAKRGGSS
ncbi:hypothetical protein BU25DRAFT_72859 [Macroventuria anomochaeta]|uniref:Uncharacterized protein n=1 Tax=Macroventuria anomochaeta TaxID=301207 RepID=A0ACB6S0V3_9PLEO|nr:uncharacterized protein BU25DRAFT_72859 [Macroventuria anomochaeta]KAF2626829.1 hypothetical protein BU25DRAFT_72859 [Macroventuria anomochaeta]